MVAPSAPIGPDLRSAQPPVLISLKIIEVLKKDKDILDYDDEDEDLLIVSITADHMALSSRVTFTPVKS